MHRCGQKYGVLVFFWGGFDMKAFVYWQTDWEVGGGVKWLYIPFFPCNVYVDGLLHRARFK
jgi:hypothetical protein